MAGCRTRIRHIEDLSFDELCLLFGNPFSLTEKTDGAAFEFGIDELGYYSRSANSKKMRNFGDYYYHAAAKFGERMQPHISQMFDFFHHEWEGIPSDFGETHVSYKGDLLFRSNMKEVEDSLLAMVSTGYHSSFIGEQATFLWHSQQSIGELPLHLGALDYPESVQVHSDLIDSVYLDPFNDLPLYGNKDWIIRDVREIVDNIPPLWGPEREGVVIHSKYITGPVKVIDPLFWQRKEERFGRKLFV